MNKTHHLLLTSVVASIAVVAAAAAQKWRANRRGAPSTASAISSGETTRPGNAGSGGVIPALRKKQDRDRSIGGFPMVSIPTVIGIVSLSYSLLCMSPFLLAQEAKNIGSDQCAEGKGGPSTLATCREQAHQNIHTVEGDVLRVEYDYLTVQQSDGKEVKLHIDENTEMIGYVGPGQHVEAKVNQQKYALLIRLIDSP